jgi:hypothetical protein
VSWEDYQNGLNGIGGGSGMDYLKGVNERERDRAAQKPQPPPPPPPAPGPDLTTYHAPPTGPVWRGGAGGREAIHAAPATLRSMAKSGAGLLCVLFVGYLLLSDPAWTWGKLIIGAAGAAAVGAIAGAALYVAIRIFLKLLKIAGVLLLSGVVLDFANVINLADVLGRLARMVGL